VVTKTDRRPGRHLGVNEHVRQTIDRRRAPEDEVVEICRDLVRIATSHHGADPGPEVRRRRNPNARPTAASPAAWSRGMPETAFAQPWVTVSFAFSSCASVGNCGVPSTVGSRAAAALSRVPSCLMASMSTGRA
jgi:hypothetical protein